MRMNWKRKACLLSRRICCILVAALFLSLPAVPAQAVSRQSAVGFYLDTVITLSAYTEDSSLLDSALLECGRYEQLLSRTVEGSDVWRINHAGGQPVEVSDATTEVISIALEVSRLSEGAFDITVAPASVLWDFTSGAAVLPDAAELADAAARTDYRQLVLEGNTVTLPEGMMVDLGAIAKGYIADQVKQYLVDRGITQAILSFGGNIVTIGEKPDGSAWKVGIQDIDAPTGTSMLVLENRDGSVVTSGIYERGFDLDGVRYHHILDPKTGWPVQNELASVTIVSVPSVWGDALATAAFILGTEKGLELIESLDGIEAVFIQRDRTVVSSSGVDPMPMP